MSWIQDLTGIAKQLLTLEKRVEDNSRDIRELRQDLKALTDFTQEVAYAVRRNQDRAEDKEALLVQQLQNELLKLENRLGPGSEEK